MASNSKKSRQKLIESALELFVSQGIANTATRQIANLAEVNEATLFRNFGNKYGLLQAVIQEAELFRALETKIKSHLHDEGESPSPLKDYALAFLKAVDEQQALLCSLIGEAENYSDEFKAKLTQTLAESNQRLTPFIQVDRHNSHLTDETFMGLLHALLLGYTILNFSSQIPAPWSTPENYVDAVLRLLDGRSGLSRDLSNQSEEGVVVKDLPRATVHALLQQAKKQGARDYAIAYLLFGAGLTPDEICALKRGDRIADSQQHVLTIRGGGTSRQVPVNQWILGKRYGSYTSNPLTRWLKTRKDEADFMFVTDAGLVVTPTEIEQFWQQACDALQYTCQLWQCPQTWRVEMLMRGVTLENLSILTGVNVEQLEPLAQRAREKTALEQAVELDKKM